MKIRPVGTELLHADRETDRHDEANRRFSAMRKAPRHYEALRSTVIETSDEE